MGKRVISKFCRVRAIAVNTGHSEKELVTILFGNASRFNHSSGIQVVYVHS